MHSGGRGNRFYLLSRVRGEYKVGVCLARGFRSDFDRVRAGRGREGHDVFSGDEEIGDNTVNNWRLLMHREHRTVGALLHLPSPVKCRPRQVFESMHTPLPLESNWRFGGSNRTVCSRGVGIFIFGFHFNSYWTRPFRSQRRTALIDTVRRPIDSYCWRPRRRVLRTQTITCNTLDATKYRASRLYTVVLLFFLLFKHRSMASPYCSLIIIVQIENSFTTINFRPTRGEARRDKMEYAPQKK